MINRELRERDIIKLIEGLDIPQSLYAKAIHHYKAIAAFLQRNGIESDIYPQGSYALGTVVRPYKGDSAYDLDAICEIKFDKHETTAKNVKQMVGNTLKSDETYCDMLQQEWDKCWTLEYADVNGIGFSMDIVPAVPEKDTDLEVMLESIRTCKDVYKSQIAITNKKGSEYEWKTSNPKAYQTWFKHVNEPFLIHHRERIKKSNYGRMYEMSSSSVEDIPESQEKSALQRVIQIIKYHADVYFTKGNIKEYKTASIVITTLVTLLAQEVDPSLEIFPLLRYIVNQLEIYGENLVLNESAFAQKYPSKNIIKHIGEQWKLMNPLNPTENLVDSWEKEPLKPKYFFQWVKILKDDYIISLDDSDEKFVVLLENNFGSNYVQKCIDLKNYANKKPVNINITTKPYRC